MNKSLLIVPLLAFLVFNSSGVSIESRVVTDDIMNMNNNNNTCELCHALVNTINHEFKQENKTISDITNIITDICHIIGGPTGKECMFIVENIQKIVNYLTKGFNTTQICDKLNLCNNTIVNSDLKLFKFI